ncbi:hypothetical protein K437DRAFT_230272 [Tilletiaria anomala UBC 951]|uniref:HNH nuclease domain-containing protein n=1 Tax=Tilletiaria anomala (strain ATCC 24038 / CBS 436.72 / UBC 951) TaxID=1037660 RepID=A0A066V856_TILAU|nr:uncharacterized protein K437DRAFT_230272 [Tilletiaria anomala UBC 951]KDN34919.1 hypothetical protein K437DRAFT_230272 [Tilletiaria anomala UBC 951]
MISITYDTAALTWGGETFQVVDGSGQRLVQIPLAFARTGRCDHVQYALSVIYDCWEENQGRLHRADGQVLALDAPLFSGTATYSRADGTSPTCVARLGPRFKEYRRAPVDGSDGGTVSASSRSSNQQNRFRSALHSRDGICFYYTEALGDSPGDLFNPSFGLLLRADLHKTFDHGLWALYEDEGNLVVHIFGGRLSQREFHGKVIVPAQRCRGAAQAQPDLRLLRFHYQQCAMRRLRGFSAGF